MYPLLPQVMVEQEWQEVRGRRARQSKAKAEVSCITFFSRNFPGQCTVVELKGRFVGVGQVEDVFISEKRDKQGKKFSFVRFKGRVDKEEVLQKLNKVWVGTYIIKAFLPRFSRPSLRKEETQQRIMASSSILPTGYGRRVDGVSFSDAQLGERGKNVYRGERECEEWGALLTFHSKDAKGSWLRGAITRKLKEEFLYGKSMV